MKHLYSDSSFSSQISVFFGAKAGLRQPRNMGYLEER